MAELDEEALGTLGASEVLQVHPSSGGTAASVGSKFATPIERDRVRERLDR